MHKEIVFPSFEMNSCVVLLLTNKTTVLFGFIELFQENVEYADVVFAKVSQIPSTTQNVYRSAIISCPTTRHNAFD